MRHIKFRAFDELNKRFEWLDFAIPANLPIDDSAVWRFPMQQYTGLKDGNGKEIYEGDIVKMGETIWQVGWYAMDAKFTLLMVSDVQSEKGFYSAGAPIRNFNWIDGGKGGNNQIEYKVYPVEVIGNIYENPELLK